MELRNVFTDQGPSTRHPAVLKPLGVVQRSVFRKKNLRNDKRYQDSDFGKLKYMVIFIDILFFIAWKNQERAREALET